MRPKALSGQLHANTALQTNSLHPVSPPPRPGDIVCEIMQQPMSPSRLRFLRIVTLVCLLFTDGTYSILRRYSRGVLREIYSVNEVLLVAEFVKLAFSCYMMLGAPTTDGCDPNDPAKTLSLAHLTKLLLHSFDKNQISRLTTSQRERERELVKPGTQEKRSNWIKLRGIPF